MRILKMICTTAFLMFALSFSTLGGEISTPGLTGSTNTSGVTQPVPDPVNPEPPKADDSLTGIIGTTKVDAVLLALKALF